MVERLSAAKAAAVAVSNAHAWVLGADTTVVIHDRILGKPSDKEEAYPLTASTPVLPGDTIRIVERFF